MNSGSETTPAPCATQASAPLRERCLWSLLYDGTVRSAEVLRLDVGDLDLALSRLYLSSE